MLSLQPTHDLVFIQKKTEEKTTGLIIIPENAGQQDNVGTVVAIGLGKTYANGNIVPLSVQVGDQVIYSTHAGQTFMSGDVELIALREDDIYAVVNRIDSE
jgi:chaperonin GroES